ncbi:MAG: hypothetical protein VYD08_08865 [Pseudomonadota bacterium]|jgi:hypothetical protein|nr:hypothetical protein [Pseudomonadota bacterium]|tara:strand:- start:73048 stop:73515 length:468 start_codon:yes stop_codon:yes gene_type:complete
MTTLSSLCNSLGLSAETALNLLDDFIKEKNLDGEAHEYLRGVANNAREKVYGLTQACDIIMEEPECSLIVATVGTADIDDPGTFIETYEVAMCSDGYTKPVDLMRCFSSILRNHLTNFGDLHLALDAESISYYGGADLDAVAHKDETTGEWSLLV